MPVLFIYFGKEDPISTCLLRVKEDRPDSCQLCPSAGSLQPGQYVLALNLCGPTTPQATVSRRKGGAGSYDSAAIAFLLNTVYCEDLQRTCTRVIL